MIDQWEKEYFNKKIAVRTHDIQIGRKNNFVTICLDLFEDIETKYDYWRYC